MKKILGRFSADAKTEVEGEELVVYEEEPSIVEEWVEFRKTERPTGNALARKAFELATKKLDGGNAAVSVINFMRGVSFEQFLHSRTAPVGDRMTPDEAKEGQLYLCRYKKDRPFVAIFMDGDFSDLNGDLRSPDRIYPINSEPDPAATEAESESLPHGRNWAIVNPDVMVGVEVSQSDQATTEPDYALAEYAATPTPGGNPECLQDNSAPVSANPRRYMVLEFLDDINAFRDLKSGVEVFGQYQDGYDVVHWDEENQVWMSQGYDEVRSAPDRIAKIPALTVAAAESEYPCRDMSKAPKDGTNIVLYRTEGSVNLGFWGESADNWLSSTSGIEIGWKPIAFAPIAPLRGEVRPCT
jgi:hypothetical protein